MEVNNDNLGEDEVFDDSSVFAHFENFSFRDIGANQKNTKNDSLNVSALCCDEEIKGYDKLTGKTWIYPTNYPIRDYQFNIINTSLLKNTLVSLPTGLGKTFIAAVVMFNFYRWYPLGKIIFMAPTRPLVAQQIEACYNIIAMPPRDTIEMTGHMQVNTRKSHWQTKRVVFATPQVIYNDIKSGICPGDRIRCLVIDEAHRARGNYAYCQIISTLTEMGHRIYRVLALSATPGSKVEDVINVVRNLHIAHLELRNENSIDVMSYSHSRKINTVIIPLGGELTQLRQQYVEILDGYARRLKQFNILPQNVGNLTKGRIVMLYKEFQSKERGARHPQHNYIMKDFTVLIALYHGLELLVKHGSRVFLNFFDEHPEKSWMQSDDKLTAFLERLRDDLGVDPLSLDRSMLPDGTIPEIPANLSFGHPKFYKLKEIMMDHFNNAKQKGQETKAIVFCEYRESVNLVHCLLLQCRPLIVPQMFVGQGASGKDGKTMTSQKQQLRVMRGFRSGASNTLVCTCVAEEGLDVGAVDLILCFDISTRSPVRLVQRCGRTGRERGGQVYILVTEGKEHQTLIECIRQRDGLNQKILQSKEVESNLYKLNPRMIPQDFMPKCQKMYITVNKEKSNDESKQSKKGQKDLRTMFGKASNGLSKEPKQSVWITKQNFDELYPKGYRDCNFFAEPVSHWSMCKESFKEKNENGALLKLSTWLEHQRNLQETVNIGHSVDSEVLTSLLKLDTKKYDLPSSTQSSKPCSQDWASPNVFISPLKNKQTKKRLKIPLIRSPCKKDGDIRTLFSIATKSTKNYTKLINDLGIQNDGKIPTRIINILVDLCLENTNATKKCYICLNVCDCKIIKHMEDTDSTATYLLPINSQPHLPNVDLIDDLNIDSFFKYSKELPDNDIKENLNLDVEKRVQTDIQNNINDSKTNFDIEIDYDVLSDHDTPVLETETTQAIKLDKEKNNFDIGGIDDIFAESSPEEHFEDMKNDSKAKDTLDYFQLDSIEDIFADSDDEVIVQNEINKHTPIRPKSPSILSGGLNSVPSKSPILYSQFQKSSSTFINNKNNCSDVTSQAKNQTIFFENKKSNYEIMSNERDFKNISDNSMLTITQIVENINKKQLNNMQDTLNKSNNNSLYNKTDNLTSRSPSPVIFTQRDKMIKDNTKEPDKVTNLSAQSSLPVSLIILDSDSDDDITQEYDPDHYNTKKTEIPDNMSNSYVIAIPNADNDNNFKSIDHTQKVVSVQTDKNQGDDNIESPYTLEDCKNTQNNSINLSNKRKFEEDPVVSPYFNKKPKFNENRFKQLTLQKRGMKTKKNNNDSFSNNDTNVNFVMLSPNLSLGLSEKENYQPYLLENPKSHIDCKKEDTVLDRLKVYRRDVKRTVNNICKDSTNTTVSVQSKNITFNDSDDDFVSDEKPRIKQKIKTNSVHDGRLINQKVNKKKKASEFLDLEAELSDDSECASGDELTDDSVGSIIDFICNKSVSHEEEDMQAIYLKSVKSPLKGGFKIPQLTNKYRRSDVLSQTVLENDTYEMDSFCVDSHIGLTQVNEESELEIAEMLLEEQKRRKNNSKRLPEPKVNGVNDESPIIKRKFKKVKRQITSDSEDSS